MNVAILAVAFDHDAVGDEVGLACGARVWLQHLLEDERGLWHIKAADAAVEQRVESDDIGSNILVVLHLFEHGLVELESLLKLVRLLVGFYHSGVDHGVHGDAVGFHGLEDVTCPANVVVFHASLQEAPVGHGAGH